MKRVTALILAIPLLLASPAQARDEDPDRARLQTELAELEGDPALGQLAGVQRLQARTALQALADASRRERGHRLFVAERRVELARAVAQVELSEQQLEQLQRERNRILLQAAQRDAELSRIEAEKLRLQSLARAEEAERAQLSAEAARSESEASMAEADQARRLAQAQSREAQLARREADLAMAAADSLRLQLQSMTEQREARGRVMTLSGAAFASGQHRLLPEARANLDRVVEFVQRYPDKSVRIEGHTDSRGSAHLNQSLSQRRAESVRAALLEEGVDATRLEAVGFGQEQPLADNASEQGRSQNRRVEIVVLD